MLAALAADPTDAYLDIDDDRIKAAAQFAIRTINAAPPPSDAPSGGKAAVDYDVILTAVRASIRSIQRNDRMIGVTGRDEESIAGAVFAAAFKAAAPSPAEQGAREDSVLVDRRTLTIIDTELANARDKVKPEWRAWLIDVRSPIRAMLATPPVDASDNWRGETERRMRGVETLLAAGYRWLAGTWVLPLAAGRVGVSEAQVRVAANCYRDSDGYGHAISREWAAHIARELTAALAGPVVAGDDMQWHATQAFALDVQKRLMESEQAMPRRTGGTRLLIDAHNAIGELLSLVYADTAKGGES